MSKAEVSMTDGDVAVKKLQLECGELKASLVSRDTEFCNLRFELEAHSNAAKQLKRKLDVLSYPRGGEGKLHGSSKSGGTIETKRKTISKVFFSTKELNKVVGDLQCIVQRQQLEIERIQIAAG